MGNLDRDGGRSRGLERGQEQEEEPDEERERAAHMRMVAMRKRHIQRKAERNAEGGAKIPESGGAPLPKELRARMEPQLGADLSGVKVHTGGESAAAAQKLGARAFTTGNEVHFGQGEFSPETKEGDRLIAHELAHTVQAERSGIQRKAAEGGEQGDAKGEHADAKGGDADAKGGDEKGEHEGEEEVSDPNDPAEKEADHAADNAVANLHGEAKGGDAKGGDAKGAGGDKGDEGGGKKGDEGGGKGAEDAGGKKGDEGGGTKEAAAPISAKLIGVGRKISMKPKAGGATAAGGQKPATGKKSGDKSGPNPNFEKDAAAFEVKLGPLAYGKGAGVGPMLMAKVRSYIEAKCASPLLGPIDKLKAELEQLTAKKGDFAGGVVSPEDIQQLLMTKEELGKARQNVEALKNVKDGNLREQMTVVANFGNVLNGDLMKTGPDEAKVEAWITQANLSKTEIEKRVEHAKAKKGQDGKTGWNDQPAGHVPSGGSRKQQGHQDAIRDQSSARQAVNPANGDKRRADRSKQGAPDDPTRTNLTADNMAEQGMPLSDREMKAQGNPEGNVPLKWSEGVKTWMVDKEHKWVQAQQKLGIPLGAGPSGTTNMIMNTGLMLGADAMSLRTACIGYLLPIHAHSLVEILTAAGAHGAAFSPGPQMYRRIEPMSEDELRGCGRPGGGGKNLFPDERDPNEK